MPSDLTPPPAARRASLEDVARRARVSLATASRALHNPDIVRADTRERVEQAAQELGYRANLAARAIAQGHSQTAAVLVTDLTDPASASVARGAVAAAARQSLLATVASVRGESGIAKLMVSRLSSQRPQAIVVEADALGAGQDRTDSIELLDRYQQAGGRVAIVGEPLGMFLTAAVDITAATEQLAAALVDLGYRRPLILDVCSAPSDTSRAVGLAAAFERLGIGCQEFTVASRHRRDAAYEAIIDRLAPMLSLVDVVCCTTDMAAIGAVAAMRAIGLRPGERIGVSGFGGIDYAEDVVPRLTTVDLRIDQLGGDAMRLAIAGTPPSPSAARVRLRGSTPPRV